MKKTRSKQGSEIKICIVVDNLDQSTGWGRLAKKFESSLVLRGVEVGFITQTSDAKNPSTLIVPLRNFSWKRPLEIIRTLLKIRKFAKNYDSVLCFDANPYGIITMLSLFGSRVPLALYGIGTYSLLTDNFLRNLLIRLTYVYASKVLIVSEFVKDQIKKSGLALLDVTIIPVGVDSAFFYPVLNRPTTIHTPYILGVGAIKNRKGFHVSLEAFSLIASQFPQINYAIVGHSDGGAYGLSLKARAKELNLENRVIFLDRVSDDELRSLYSFAEFFLLTPLTSADVIEGFGMVYLEAASCGITAIGTNNSGAKEAIIDKETGLLVEPDSEEIAEAMRVLLNDEGLRLRLSKAAKIRSTTFEWSAVTDRLLKALAI